MGAGAVLTIAAGDIVFREGDPGDLMYILVKGTVELKMHVDKGETVLKTIEKPNDFFGEMALIDGRPRSATAVAAAQTTLIPVDRQSFENMILANGKFALTIIKVLSERIRRSNDQVEELIETSPRDRIMYGMADFALRVNERIHDGSYKAQVEEMKAWINTRMGIPLDEIEAGLFRLMKGGTIVYAATSAKTKEHILLPERFVQEYDRRQ